MASDMSDSLKPHLIPDIPSAMYYIPNFITAQEETQILSKIPTNRWITLTHRRLQSHPTRLTASNVLAATTPLAPWLTTPCVARIHDLGVFASAPHGVNHCLVNEYEPGQGIMPHEDGAAYWPVVATVSLGGTVVLDVSDKGSAEEGGAGESSGERKKTWRVLQEPRSLLLTTGLAYTETLHGIAEAREDVGLGEGTVANWGLLGDREGFQAAGGKNVRETRISLTFRDVLKVSNVGSKIFGKPRG